MNLNPLFSIVIVNYNYGEYLKYAIESIVQQSYTNYELIIIDGGSTDNSIDIIKSYSSKIKYWVSEKDNGQSNAFNKGFSRATGDYFFWLNADDILVPNSLDIVAKYINKNIECKWFVANTIFFDENNTIIRCRRGIKWKDFLIHNGPIYVYGPTSIFHKSLFIESGGFDESLYYTMDTDLWMRFANLGYKFKRVPAYVWALRIHSKSKTSHAFESVPDSKFLKERIAIQNKNNWKYNPKKILIQKLYKLLSGVYLSSYFDTLKKRGKILK